MASALARNGRPGPWGRQGNPGGSALDASEAFQLGLIEEAKDIALHETAERLEAEHGLKTHPSTIGYFLDRRGINSKEEAAHAAEQQRADVGAARQAWFEGQPDLDPDRLVFIDETGLNTKMARLRGRAPTGERCRPTRPTSIRSRTPSPS